MGYAPVRILWVNGLPVLASEMDALDGETVDLINFDLGGTWTPSAPVVWASASGYTGPVFNVLGAVALTSSGGVVRTPSASGKRIVFGDGDYYELDAGHPGITFNRLDSFVDGAAAINPTLGSSTTGLAEIAVPIGVGFSKVLRPHHGATWTQVTVNFKVTNAHSSGAPATLPKVRVVQVDATGAKTPLKTVASGADINGWLSVPTPASGSAWFNSGNPQSLVYTFDAGVLLDTSRYVYVLEVVEESGTNATGGTAWESAVGVMTAISDTRAPQ